ncbi:uncharacterized protein VTP21DRAFT_11134 [Calcarisporiella thermophila]|uniref:uncharacterized protein n=1 Tax=Calcarisporiella thermophila TaxID=911321 RepID=UPI0037424F93
MSAEEDENIASLRDEVNQLREQLRLAQTRRDQLRQLIADEEASTDLRGLIASASEKNNEDTHFQRDHYQLIQDLMADTEARQAAELNSAYRLAGRTMFPVKGGHVGIRLETFYKGKYHEPYYIILRHDIGNDRLEITKHTIPPFIPLRSLEQLFLNDSLEAFLKELDEYLQGFVFRREQVKALQTLSGRRVKDLATNKAFTYVQFTTQVRRRVIQVNLIYEDLKESLPTRLAIMDKQENEEGIGRRYFDKEKHFLKQDLVEAFDQAFPRE